MEEKENLYQITAREEKWLLTLLVLSCMCLFAGRAFQHFFQDIPLREILWDPSFMKAFVNIVLNLQWEDYVSDPYWDNMIQNIIRAMGVVYLICLIACLLIYFNLKKYVGKFLILGSAGLLMLSFIYFVEKFFRIGELFEYTAQCTAPIVLYMLAYNKAKISVLNFYMRLATALTFAGHGLYALGYYPVPGNFIDMIIMALHVEENTAVMLLKFAGWIDLTVAMLIMAPFVYPYAAFYAFVWGLLTAIARVWSNYDENLPFETLNQWLPETLVRIPNALTPLAVFFISIKLRKKDFNAKVKDDFTRLPS